MPELPEVQALAERIEQRLAGARFERASALSFSALKTVSPEPDALRGLRLEGVGRRGKFLVFSLDPLRLLVHLSQGGRLVFEEGPSSTRPRGSVVRFRFDSEPGLLVKEFGTERKAGWWVVGPGEPGPLVKLGPEPLSEEFETLVLKGSDGGQLHPMLRDQRRVAGIGRGYGDDILHRAGLSPFRSLTSLDGPERWRLLESVRSILAEALEVERGRSGGLPTKLGDHFIVHGKAGTSCPVCDDDLRRVSFESHEITYCPSCQTGGKILADRRLSRLLR
jgi:formamidopyrimidine-DNA glycosylase